ncbi:MAG TPA: CBS domain-containing protein [Steroidobacteraceae bacterium]|nr:CBS domain-containing protein [Steroidobacteraceae bacterium]
MNVGELCGPRVFTVREFDELSTAARLMRERHVGYLVVVEPLPLNALVRPVGVITDRDIVVSVVAKDQELRALRVGDVMTRQPVVVSEDASIEQALQKMRAIGIRRIPVVGGAGQLLGVISLDDILDALSKQLADVSGSMSAGRRLEGALRP